MFPFPSAVNEPTLARKLLDSASEPLIENAYGPFKLALEKFPVGGGGVVVEPLPLQAAENPAAQIAIVRTNRLYLEEFIAQLPLDWLAHLPTVSFSPQHQLPPIANPASTALRPPPPPSS